MRITSDSYSLKNQECAIDVIPYKYWNKALEKVFASLSNSKTKNMLIRRRTRQEVEGEKDHQLRSIKNVLKTIHSWFYMEDKNTSAHAPEKPINAQGKHHKEVNSIGTRDLRSGEDDNGLALLKQHQSTQHLLNRFHSHVLRGCTVGLRHFPSSRYSSNLFRMV